MNIVHHSVQWLIVTVLRIYQAVVSPLLPASCRFYPTCSHYAMESIERFGVVQGVIMAVRRIARCHPWNEGGFDPVPTSIERE